MVNLFGISIDEFKLDLSISYERTFWYFFVSSIENDYQIWYFVHVLLWSEHSWISYLIDFWVNSSIVLIIFILFKSVVGVLYNADYRDYCRPLFKALRGKLLLCTSNFSLIEIYVNRPFYFVKKISYLQCQKRCYYSQIQVKNIKKKIFLIYIYIMSFRVVSNFIITQDLKLYLLKNFFYLEN